MKSTVEQIRERFDQDVDRFSNLETGQSATVDAPLTLELIASVAASTTPSATHLLDIVVAAAVFHHLREDGEWSGVFRKCHRALRPGGAIWISDLVAHQSLETQAVMWARY